METRSKKRKRKRLISISSNVSSWPHVPARFESLNDDTLTTILHLVGNKSYKAFGGMNYHCREIYLNTKGMTKETFLFGYGPLKDIIDKIERFYERAIAGRHSELLISVSKGVVHFNRRDVLDWALQDGETILLSLICDVAAEEERFELLNELWDDIDDENDKREIFQNVDHCAAYHSKLNVLKWLENKGLPINKNDCARAAARGGNIGIFQWLKEEKGLELKTELHFEAVCGGHLNVMKWLREQEVDWDKRTFTIAAERGNLDILQWLHDEGCPWPRRYIFHVHVIDLKPDVIEWCRVNGYSDLIDFESERIEYLF